jgi:hypothetical protein
MTLVNRRVFQELALPAAAGFAIFWAIFRAEVQSITIDEADTYVFFAAKSLNNIWLPATNNHVLNSLLMWVSTRLFGTFAITARVPALLGAVLYICVCCYLCQRITHKLRLQLPLFICLTYNPFVFDFMVAARGYSLALAFLVAAIAVPVWHLEQEGRSLLKSCALASLFLGLSFSSNFSFAVIDGVTFLAIAMWAVRRRGQDSFGWILTACVVPGLAVSLLICGYALFHWPTGELSYGAKSLGQMTKSIIDASLFRLDPRFGKAGLYRLMAYLKPALLPMLAIFCVLKLIVTRVEGAWLHDEHWRRMGRLAAALAGIASLAIFIHWLAFRLYQLPLPLDRTAIYLVPFATLIAGIIAAVPARSRAGIWLHRGLAATIFTLAFYFLFCLRLTYFKEWEWNADVKDVYPVLARYNHQDGVTEIATDWWYGSPLNFYRLASGRETFEEIKAPLEPVPGKKVYVLHGLFDRKFIDQERLTIVYRGAATDIVVAVNPKAVLRPISVAEP